MPTRSTGPTLARALLAYAAVRLTVLGTLWVVAEQAGRDPLRLLLKWDGQWYARIAADGYGQVVRHSDGRLLSDAAFFPLYPALERVVAAATDLPEARAGLAISVVASVIAAAGIHRLTALVYGERAAFATVVLWALLPVGPVQWMAYSESLFTALAAWALWATLRERWWLAGILAALAGATRPTGVAVIVAVVVAALVALRGRTATGRSATTSTGPLVGAVLLAPTGAAAYLGWLAWRERDLLAYQHLTAGWGNSLDGGRGFVVWVGRLLTQPPHWPGVAVVAGVVLVLALLVVAVRDRQPLPLIVFAAVLVAMAFATSGYFGSKPRYLLPAVPLLMPVADALAARPAGQRRTVYGLALAGAAAFGAWWLLGDGPP